jgi:uncharacterized protein
MTESSDPQRATPSGDAFDQRVGDPVLEPVPAEIVTAELARSPATEDRPVWPAMVVCLGAIFLSAIISGVVLVLVAFLDRGPEVLRDGAGLMSWLQEYSQSRHGLLIVVLPSQMVFLLIACAAAAISPRPFGQRLSLSAGVLPFWTWAAFVVGTPIVGLGSSQILSLLVDQLSENLEFLESMMRWHLAESLPLLIILVAVVPGVVEELLFRGYLQTRLAERWRPVWAITVSAVIFSAAHLDPLHGVGVLPLGLWLGAVAWRTGSVWPAVLCHAANNAMAILGVKFQPEDAMGIGMDSMSLGTLIVCGPAFLFSLYLFRNR